MFTQSTLSRSGGKVIFATDMDEILVNISPILYEDLIREFEHFAPYLNHPGELTFQQVMQRPVYYIDQWLKKEGAEIPPQVMMKWMGFFTHPDFYRRCKLTRFGYGLATLLAQSWFHELVIVTHTIKGMEDGKVEFVKKYLDSPKVKLEMVDPTAKKSDVLKNYEYVAYADDSIPVIKDVISNTNCFDKEFFIPKLGYNDVDHDTMLLAAERGAKLKVYHEVE